MKKKRLLASVLASFVSFSTIFAPLGSIPAVYAADNTQTFAEEDSMADIPVTCEISSGYTVILPASVTLGLDSSKENYNVGARYDAGVIGNIASEKFVIVTPTKTEAFELKDRSGKRSIKPVITQEDISWSSEELGMGESRIDKAGSIYANIPMAGSYTGDAEFEYYLSDADVESSYKDAVESRLELSLNGKSIKDGDDVAVNVNEDLDLSVSATLDGKAIDNSKIDFATTNEDIKIDEDGALMVSHSAKPGDTATITASVDPTTVLAMADSDLFSKLGIVDTVQADSSVKIVFDITLFDINFENVEFGDVDTVVCHPGDKLTIKPSITPAAAIDSVIWSKTINSGSLSVSSDKTCTVKVAKDVPYGTKFDIIATVGIYSKQFHVLVDHTWSDSEVVEEPTCTEDGLKVWYCDCGEEKEEIIPALGHDYEIITVAPTYEEEGYDLHRCKRCGDEYKDNYVPKLEIVHNYGTPSYSWTADHKMCVGTRPCIDEGFEDLFDSEVAYATIEEIHVDTPTCKNPGGTKYTATFVNEVYKTQTYTDQNEVPHNYVVTTVAPTKTEQGYDLHKCSVCGHSFKDNFTDPVDSFADGVPGVYTIDKKLALPLTRAMVEKDRTSGNSIYTEYLNDIKANLNGSTGNLNSAYGGGYVILPTGTTKIGNYCFSEMSVALMSMPSTVKSVGSYALSPGRYGVGMYHDVPNIDLSNITYFGDSAFYNYYPSNEYNKMDRTLNLGSSVTYIGASAFQSFYFNNTRIEIPATCTKIGDYAFSGNYAYSLSGSSSKSYTSEPITYVVKATNPTIGSGAFDTYGMNKSLNLELYMTSIPTNFYNSVGNYRQVWNKVTLYNTQTIGEKAFYNCAIQEITFPSTLKTINTNAFYNDSEMKVIDLSNTQVTTINAEAFRNCKNIETLRLPSTVTTIGNGAFEYDSKITYVNYLPKLVTLGDYAFNDTGLTEFIMSDTVTSDGTRCLPNTIEKLRWSTSISYLNTAQFPKLKYVEIPAGVKEIYVGGKSYCTNLVTATFADTANWYTAKTGGKQLALGSTPESAATALKNNTASTIYNRNTANVIKLEIKNGEAVYTGSATNGGAYVKAINPSSGVTIKYGTSRGSYTSTSVPTFKEIGTYTVYYQATKSGYATSVGELTIKIGAGSVYQTIPEVRDTDLTYSGSDQSLLKTNGSAINGTIYYGLSDDNATQPSTWSTTAPKKRDAGTYYVWAKVQGANSNYIGVDPRYLGSVKINPKSINVTWSESISDTANCRKTSNRNYDMNPGGGFVITATNDANVSMTYEYTIGKEGVVKVNEAARWALYEGEGKTTLTVKVSVAGNNYVCKNDTITYNITCTDRRLPGLYDKDHNRLASLTVAGLKFQRTANKNLPQAAGVNPSDVVYIVFPDFGDTAEIGAYAFYKCTNLKNVYLNTESGPFKKVTIGEHAFEGCSNLTEVNIYVTAEGEDALDPAKQNVVTAGAYSFRNCYKLKTVHHACFTAIRDYAFENCTALEEIDLDRMIIDDKAESETAFKGCPSTLKKNYWTTEGKRN